MRTASEYGNDTQFVTKPARRQEAEENIQLDPEMEFPHQQKKGCKC